MFLNRLKDIEEALNNHHNNRDDLLVNYIQERLQQSLLQYYNTLSKSEFYLKYNTQSSTKTILKGINKNE